MNWIIPEETKHNIKVWLKERKLPAYRLARRMNWSESMLSRVLNGQKPWHPRARLRFIELYGIDTYLSLFGPVPESDEIKLKSLEKGANNDG